MRTLTAAQLARMKTTVEADMPDALDIQRPSPSINSRGGTSNTTYITVSSAVKCRISPQDADERVQGEQVKAISGYRVYFPIGTDVRPQDRLVMSGLTIHVTESYSNESYPLAVMVIGIRVR